jgi:hypothetical protein
VVVAVFAEEVVSTVVVAVFAEEVVSTVVAAAFVVTQGYVAEQLIAALYGVG